MLVSVVIPCFNVEHFITECIESVVSQTHQELEIICVDNNSNDNTWSILLELKNKYPRIFLVQEMKKGANAARNKGLDIATGEWIQFLDADDLIEPTKIEHQVKLIRNSNVSLSFIAASSKRRNLKGEDTIVSNLDANHFVAPFICKSGNTCSNLWNRKKLAEVGNWDENIRSSQETALMLKIVLNSGNYIFDEKPLTIVREREEGQISQGDPEKKWKQFIELRLNFLEKLMIFNKNTYDLNKNLFFDFLMSSIITLAKYNRSEAIRMYELYIKNNWKPSGNYGFSKFKVVLIKVFGLNFFLYLSRK